MNFEWDPEKDAANREKHGMGFDEATMLWTDANILFFASNDMPERRDLYVARWRGRHWLAVVTYRVEKIRIISVRRARKNEIEAYDRHSNQR